MPRTVIEHLEDCSRKRGSCVCPARLAHEAERRRERRVTSDEVRRSNLWRRYRIRVETYDALREAQGGRRAICDRHESEIDVTKVGGRPRKDGSPTPMEFALAVDHVDTPDGPVVRGLLCPSCNWGIAGLQHDKQLLLRAVEYLERAS